MLVNWLLGVVLILGPRFSFGAETTCSQAGKFGPNCAFSCHCNLDCDKESGQCPRHCLQPWSGPSCQRENVAYRKEAHSSGRFRERWGEDKAVDGIRDGDVHNNSCYHSNEWTDPSNSVRPTESWFYLDLGRQYRTHNITFYGRDEYQHRLHLTRLFVSNTPNDRQNPCYTFDVLHLSGRNIVNLICDREGRYVTLYDNHDSANETVPSFLMEICELEVYVCADGTFGVACQQRCFCRNGVPCDYVTGTCPDGCVPGYHGDTCSLRCPSGTFGDNCSLNCHCLSGSCDVFTGQCQGACAIGWRGVTCSLPCAPGRFGVDCAQECHCQNETCHHVTGRGCQGRCARGFLGDTCSSGCQETHFRENCASACHCRVPGCDPMNGTCHVQGCQVGYQGRHCNTDVDECQQSGNVCEETAACVNIPGSFLCVDTAGCSAALVGGVGGGVAGAAVLLLVLQALLCLYSQRRRRQPETEAAYSSPSRPEAEMSTTYSTLNVYEQVVPDESKTANTQI